MFTEECHCCEKQIKKQAIIRIESDITKTEDYYNYFYIEFCENCFIDIAGSEFVPRENAGGKNCRVCLQEIAAEDKETVAIDKIDETHLTLAYSDYHKECFLSVAGEAYYPPLAERGKKIEHKL